MAMDSVTSVPNLTDITDHSTYNLSLDGAAASGSATCMQSVRFVINTVIAGTICSLGFIGNTISFVVLSKDREAPVASFLLQALAFVDNFFLCIWYLHFSLSDMFTYLQIHTSFHVSWLYVRVYSYPLLFIGQTGTIWMIVLIAVSRYMAVCKPYKAVHYNTIRIVRNAVIVVLSASVLYNIPRFFETTIVCEVRGGTPNYTLQRTAFGNTKAYGLLYFDSLYYISSFILPLSLLVFLNTRLTMVYRRVRFRRNSMTLRQDNSREQNISLVMIIVILVFILCNAPARIAQIIWGYRPQNCLSVGFFMVEISNILEVFNSSSNFVIYCVYRAEFRNILYSRLFSTRQSVQSTVNECLPIRKASESYFVNHVTAGTALTSELAEADESI